MCSLSLSWSCYAAAAQGQPRALEEGEVVVVEVELEHTQISAIQKAKGAVSELICTGGFIPRWLRCTDEDI